ncbi:uncharacterized protein VTP21DRAFT_5426 [Calcarisporiella thermophila]|uniref:uncharacterized protein n=1 Tax=Calcarisporiella thermophila TaxID=911321 RepID=UPI003743F19B
MGLGFPPSLSKLERIELVPEHNTRICRSRRHLNIEGELILLSHQRLQLAGTDWFVARCTGHPALSTNPVPLDPVDARLEREPKGFAMNLPLVATILLPPLFNYACFCNSLQRTQFRKPQEHVYEPFEELADPLVGWLPTRKINPNRILASIENPNRISDFLFRQGVLTLS